jgi:two-component system, NtrC family, response regulator AtoC
VRVFVVDDEREMTELVQVGLKKRGFIVSTFGNGADALAALAEHDVDVVVTDLNMKRMTGLELCQHVVADRPDIPVIVLTAFGSFETAVGAIRAGAYDFVTKPVEIEALAIAIRRAGEHRQLRGEVKRLRAAVETARGRHDLVGASPAMRKIYDLIEQVSATDATVLITGEAGTGKGVVARAIHDHGRRRAASFVTVNCAALPEPFVESELVALFEQARGGTLFLEEIAELAVSVQPKLLRIVQEHDVRIIAATHGDLEEMVEDRRFREDLYYRINVIHVPLPPLRARGGDVLLLAQHLLRHYAVVFDKNVVGISPAAAEKLVAYDWPGNVRELGNCIEHAVSIAHFEDLRAEDLPEKLLRRARTTALSGTDLSELLTLEEVERRHVLRVLDACNGNRTDAAKILGLDRKTLYRKLLRWGVGDDT